MADLEQLKAKYSAVIQLCKDQNVILQHVHMQDDKLFIQGNAPNEAIKNNVWNAIKAVDSTYSDLTAEIGIDSSIPLPATKYTVQPGDSLSKIAQTVYGDMKLYTKILEANKEITDPNLIRVGQVLVIPPK
jgi:hypothetical protein